MRPGFRPRVHVRRLHHCTHRTRRWRCVPDRRDTLGDSGLADRRRTPHPSTPTRTERRKVEKSSSLAFRLHAFGIYGSRRMLVRSRRLPLEVEGRGVTVGCTEAAFLQTLQAHWQLQRAVQQSSAILCRLVSNASMDSRYWPTPHTLDSPLSGI